MAVKPLIPQFRQSVFGSRPPHPQGELTALASLSAHARYSIFHIAEVAGIAR
jgi:hypothetical protein